MYELVFEPNERDKKRYEICFQAVMLYGDKITRDVKPDVMSLVKKLKSIGAASEDRIGNTVLFELQEEGGTLLLESSEYRFLLEKAVSAEIWRPQALEAQDDTEQWLRSLKKFQPRKVEDAEQTSTVGS